MKMKAAVLHEQGRPRPLLRVRLAATSISIDLTLPSPAASGRDMGIFY